MSEKNPIWYLAHPIAPDDRFTLQQNLDHVLHMMRLCFDEGFRVVAPYHTHCLVLDDNNFEHRAMGLQIDCELVQRLGRIILTGHKISNGMRTEYGALTMTEFFQSIDLTCCSDEEARRMLRAYRS